MHWLVAFICDRMAKFIFSAFPVGRITFAKKSPESFLPKANPFRRGTLGASCPPPVSVSSSPPLPTQNPLLQSRVISQLIVDLGC